jgi:hypothetical protein
MDRNNKHTKNSWRREGRLHVVEKSGKAACACLKKKWGRGLGISNCNWDVGVLG